MDNSAIIERAIESLEHSLELLESKASKRSWHSITDYKIWSETYTAYAALLYARRSIYGVRNEI